MIQIKHSESEKYRFSVQKMLFWTVFLMGYLVFILGGCGKRKIVSPAEITPRVPIIRVALEDKLSKGNLLFPDPFKLVSEEATYILNEEMGNFSVTFSEDILSLKSEKRSFSFRKIESVEIIPVQNGVFKWNGSSYYGKIVFTRRNNRLQLVNLLPLPQYLQGVVPHEMPSHSEEYYQAIKAQTIAARTYAIYRIRNPESKDFDLYSDTRDQVYWGVHQNTFLVEKAIKETYGLVLETPQGKLRKIQYHSTCGGNLDTSASSADSIRKKIYVEDLSHNEINCIVSPLYRWTAKLTTLDILNNMLKLELIKDSDAHLWKENGFTMQLEVQSRKPSGRIDKLAISIESKSYLLKDWQIRRVFTNRPEYPQPSTLFILKSSPSEPDLVYVIGAGFGHGRGMCQWGAIGQSLNGNSFTDILNFYYPDLVLKKVY